MAQAIAEALDTPIELIWPPEDNPAAATALRAIRDQRAKDEAREVAKARDLDAHKQREATLATTRADTGEADEVWSTPAVSHLPRRVPNPLDIVATLDGKDAVAHGARRPARRRRLLLPTAVGVLVAAATGTAIATTQGDDTPKSSAASVARSGPTPAERERASQQAALAQAADRGDFDRAITIAARLNDTNAIAELRETAGGTLARRARSAAERGDLDLATSRLRKAEKRYGELPAIDAVRRRIEAIKDARARRVAARKRATQRRAAARARAAAAAASEGQSPSTPDASRSPEPTSPAPEPSPAPASPTPAPSTGGGSSSGGGSGTGSKPADDPFDF